jgi:hypothetical protein
MNAMRRTISTVAATLVWLVALAVPASAHSVSGVSATNFETTLTGMSPRIPGVSVKVIEAGSRLELTNTTDEDVIVYGYQHDTPTADQYLRIGPAGVFENKRSPAVYLTAVRRGNVAVPGSADPTAAPQWVKISSGHTARWHDHRSHWMSDQNPPQVRRAPGDEHLIDRFEVPMSHGGRPVTVTGTLTWVPGPSSAPWWVLAAALAAVTAVLVLVGRGARWAVPLTAALLLLVAVDAVHAAGIALAAAGSLPSQLGKLAGGSFASFIAWAVALAGIPFLRRRDDDGLWFAGFAAVFIALVGGVSDIGDLSRSQVPFAWGAGLARALVAITLGLAVGVLVSVVALLVRHRQREPVEQLAPATSDA